MSDKLGEYIHLRFRNYNKYGLNRSTSGIVQENFSPTKFFYDYRKTIIQDLKDNENNKYYGKKATIKKTFENQLNYYYTSNHTKIIDNLGLSEEEFQQIFKLLEKQIDNYKPSIGEIDYKSGRFVGVPRFNEQQEQALRKLNNYVIGQGKNIGVEAVEKRINALIGVRDNLSTMIKNGNANAQVLQNKIDILNKEYNSFKTEVSLTGGKAQYKDYKNVQNQKYANFGNDLNALIKEVAKLLNGPLYQGKFFELYAIAMNKIAYKGFTTGMKELTNMFNDKNFKMQGSVGSRHAIDYQNYIAADINKLIEGEKQKAFTSRGHKFENGVIYDYVEREDKIDAYLTFDDNATKMNIPVSLKNYNLKTPGDVHLLKGASLLRLLQEHGLFLNHYLNVNAQPKGGYNSGKYDRLAGQDKRASNSLKNASKMAMQTLILLKAVSGGVISYDTSSGKSFKTASADLFIINDNSNQMAGKNRVKVYFVSDLIRAIYDTIQNSGDNFRNQNILKVGDFDDTVIVNKFAPLRNNETVDDAANRRIASLLISLHQMKLNVSIDKKIFSSKKLY